MASREINSLSKCIVVQIKTDRHSVATEQIRHRLKSRQEAKRQKKKKEFTPTAESNRKVTGENQKEE